MLHKHFLQQLTSAHWQALAASFPSLCASQHFQLCEGYKKSVPSRSESYTTIWMIGKNLCCFVVNKFHALPLAAWRLASVMWLSDYIRVALRCLSFHVNLPLKSASKISKIHFLDLALGESFPTVVRPMFISDSSPLKKAWNLEKALSRTTSAWTVSAKRWVKLTAGGLIGRPQKSLSDA